MSRWTMEDIKSKGLTINENKPPCAKCHDVERLYIELGSVWAVGEMVGWSGQKVHYHLSNKGLVNKMNYWKPEDDEFLNLHYLSYKSEWNLDELAKIMGRTKAFIARKAKALGLTGSRPKMPKEHRESLSKNTKNRIKKFGHPKGMKGKFHTQETKKVLSECLKKRWSEPGFIFNSPEYRQKQSDRMSKMQASGRANNNYSRTKSGTVEIGNKQHFYRSSWEVNIAAYFEFLKNNGNIKDWQYEPTVFWFENIKRGVRSYKPDFLITENNDTQYYVEVKGWMDSKSKTKINRMRIYYPKVRLDIICQKRYKEISKVASLIPHWGDLDKNPIEFKTCSIQDCGNKSHSKDLCRKHFYKAFKK